MTNIVNWIHRTVWVATGLLCFYVAFDSLSNKRGVLDVVILVMVGGIFMGLTGWAIWRERREREQETVLDTVGELKDLP